MLTKLMPAVVSLWVLLFSAQAIAESFSDTVNRVLPSVCMVISTVIDSPGENQDNSPPDHHPGLPPLEDQTNPFDEFLENQSQHAPTTPGSMGTCFIISYKNEKFVITNHHVINSIENTTIEVRFYGSFKIYLAIIVGEDKMSDIAVLKMATPEGQAIIENIRDLQWGNSNNMRQGDDAWAVGHPLQQEWSVSKGIISYVGRRTNNIWQELIQSDVAINNGNSGGPLLNMKGEVIGVNTFIVSPSPGAGSIGVNFSVTSNATKHVVEQLVDTGSVKRAKIGLLFEIDYDKGLFVIKELEPGSPGEIADIRPEDLIIKINGRNIYSIDDLGKALDYVLPGDEIEIVILRGDEILFKVVKTIEVTHNS
jgi:S1-C subfamily serine protease